MHFPSLRESNRAARYPTRWSKSVNREVAVLLPATSEIFFLISRDEVTLSVTAVPNNNDDLIQSGRLASNANTDRQFMTLSCIPEYEIVAQSAGGLETPQLCVRRFLLYTQ